MMPAAVVALALFLGTGVWLFLLLGSTLFPPKPRTQMRVAEKGLVLMSALLIVAWLVMMLNYIAEAA